MTQPQRDPQPTPGRQGPDPPGSPGKETERKDNPGRSGRDDREGEKRADLPGKEERQPERREPGRREQPAEPAHTPPRQDPIQGGKQGDGGRRDPDQSGRSDSTSTSRQVQGSSASRGDQTGRRDRDPNQPFTPDKTANQAEEREEE